MGGETLKKKISIFSAVIVLIVIVGIVIINSDKPKNTPVETETVTGYFNVLSKGTLETEYWIECKSDNGTVRIIVENKDVWDSLIINENYTLRYIVTEHSTVLRDVRPDGYNGQI